MPIRPQTSASLSITHGAPLDSISGPGDVDRVDGMLSRAARMAPQQLAIQTLTAALTYAELDARVTDCAEALTGLLGPAPVVVALVSILDPVFAVGYYGIARSGHTCAILNPLMPAQALLHALGASGAQAAILTPEVWERLRPQRSRLSRLRHVILTRRTAITDRTDGLPVLADLIAAAARRVAGTDVAAAGPAEVACVMFTSGTTGVPKSVPLTHRNVVINAAQTVDAQDLGPASVLLNHLPTFHTMHLNASVHAVATLILHTGDDPAGAIDVANRYGVTHYYSLPVRLAGLAADPRLNRFALRTARALLSGGSALPPATATILAEHFAIPVVQGYGLAEASPLTHFNRSDDPRPGSCGRPVAGTDSRIVDVTSRQVLPVGANGEVQIKGPQLMSGYLGQKTTAEIDTDGWFSTGDVGHVDADGYLYLTDRLKDVFKCDNFLVSPTEVENVLRLHPDVIDCVVVDCADAQHGAVAYGLVVLRQRDVATDTVLAFTNRQLPYYMHLRHLEVIDEIPRSANGKVQRRDLRERVHAAFNAGDPSLRPQR